MSILEDYANECMYARDAWFIDKILELNPEEKRIIGQLNTEKLTTLVEHQRIWPGHPKHFPGAVAIQMTATLGQLYAIYVLGLRATEGWVGFGTHIKKAKFGALGVIGPTVEAKATCIRARQFRGTWFTDFEFEYTQNSKLLYASTQTAAWIQGNPSGKTNENGP